MLTHYFTEMESCKQSMASLGAEFLRNNSSKVEAAETVALRSSADRATLISVADTVSRGIEIAFEFVFKNHLLLVVKIGGIVYVSHYFEDDRERIFILPYIG